MPRDAVHKTGSNPSLVLDKYVEWPKRKPLTKNPREKKTEEKKLPVKRKPAWLLEERNQEFFLKKTVVPLLKNFEAKRLPSAALKDRDSLLKTSLASSEDFLLKSIEIVVEFPFFLAQNFDSVVKHSGLSLDFLFGYQILPASLVRRLARSYARFLLKKEELSEEHFNAIFGEKNSEGSIIFLDSHPLKRIGDGRLARFKAYPPDWDAENGMIDSNKTARGILAFRAQQAPSFELNIASRKSDDAEELLEKTTEILTQAIAGVNNNKDEVSAFVL